MQRMQREEVTIEAMIRLYCRDHHNYDDDGLCEECSELLNYARKRLANCPFQEGKTTCGKCQVHCYQPKMRERIRQVMRYSGPRMLLHHPLMSLMHLVDGLRKKPIRPPKVGKP